MDPISVLSLNSTPISSISFRRLITTSFSSLKGGIPKVNSPPISGLRSKTTGFIPFLIRISAHPSPAGPAPTIATRWALLGRSFCDGFQPWARASSVIYFSMAPMVTAPNPSLRVHAPSHSLSCGQILPQISGRELVRCDSSAASKRRPSLTSFSQFGIRLCTGHSHSQ